MVHILSQLGDDYSTIVAAIKVRDTSLSYSELFDRLTDFERALKETSLSSDSIPAIVNYTSRNSGFQNKSNNNNNSGSHNNYYNRNNRSPPSYQSRGAPQSQWNNHNTSGTRSNRSNKFCHFCNIPGHTTKDCRKLARFLRDNNIVTDATKSQTPQAHVTTSAPASPQWLFDTGASNHVTSDHNNLHQVSEYGGPDEIVLGDGFGHGGASHARRES